MLQPLALPGVGALDTRPAPGRMPRPLALVVVSALVVLLAQGWAPQLVHGPSQATPVTAASARPSPAAPAPALDGEAAVRAARHQVAAVPGSPGVLGVHDGTYQATFDPGGFSYLPATASTPLQVDLVSVGAGATTRPAVDVAWSADGSAAHRSLGGGAVERVTARQGEVEWDVVLSRPLSTSGDIAVRARIDGLAPGAGAVVPAAGGRALQLRLAGGHTVRLGELVVVDATGRELHRALPTVDGDELVLSVPASALRGATYPVTLDPTVGSPLPVTPAGNRSQPSVAFDGTNFLVVWTEVIGAQSDILGAQVDGNGGAAHPAFLISSSPAVNDVGPDVAFDGSSFLVVWEQQLQPTNADIVGRRVTTTGSATGSVVPLVNLTSVQRAPAVAGNTASGGFYVVWHDCRVGGNCDIFGGRVSYTGANLDGNGVQVSLSTKNDFVPDVAFNGTRYLVVWEDQFNASDDDILMSLVTAANVVQGGGSIVANPSGRQRDPAVASNGTGWYVVWEDARSGTNDIYGQPITSEGVPPDFLGTPICTIADEQNDAAIVFNGSYLAAWRDRRNGTNGDILVSRIATNGTITDPNGFVVTNTTADEDSPAVSKGPGGGWAVDYENGPAGTTSIVQRAVSK